MGLTELKSMCQQDYISSGGSRGESVSLPFQFLVHFLAHGPFLHLQRKKCSIFKTITMTSFFGLPLPVIRTLVITLGLPGYSRILS